MDDEKAIEACSCSSDNLRHLSFVYLRVRTVDSMIMIFVMFNYAKKYIQL